MLKEQHRQEAIGLYVKTGLTSLIKLNGKVPLELGWVDKAHETFNESRWHSLLAHTGNYGLAIPKSLVVIDADTQKDSKMLREWFTKNKLTFWEQSTSKGAHYVFKRPVGVVINNTVKTNFGDAAFDIRSFGGQIAVWPSVHPDGTEYVWRCSPWSHPMAGLSTLPDQVLEELANSKVRFKNGITQEHINEGSRNQTIFKMGSSMRSKRFGEEAIRSALESHNKNNCHPPLPDNELEVIINQINKYDPGNSLEGNHSVSLHSEPTVNFRIIFNMVSQLRREYINKDKSIAYVRKIYPMCSQQTLDAVIEILFLKDDKDPLVIRSPEKSFDDYLSLLKQDQELNTPELPTGLPLLDKMLWGVRRGELLTVGARTGVGKTSLLVGIAHYLCTLGKKILFVSTETPYFGIFNRIMSRMAGVPTFKLDTRQMSKEDWERVHKSLEVFKTFNLSILGNTQPSLAIITKSIEQYKPDVLFIDHIQHTAMASENRYGEISRFVKGLKNIALEYNCAVVIASQLNRVAATEVPTVAHLKECGTIEEESTAVLLLHKTVDSPENEVEPVMGILAKNRGPKGIVNLMFNKPFTCFFEQT